LIYRIEQGDNMAVTDFVTGSSTFIGNAVQAIIFWSDWDPFSKYLLMGLVGFLVAAYMYMKYAVMKSGKQFPKRRKR